MSDDRPSSPEEAWRQRAIAVREELSRLSDDELIDRVRRRRVDLTFGLWDVIVERRLGPEVVGAILAGLVEVPQTHGDWFLDRYHAACALLKLVDYPCEVIAGGDFNQTAAGLASDFYGEAARQQTLREFWAALVPHAAARGVTLDAEPAWPSTFPRYVSAERLVRRPGTGGPTDAARFRGLWRATHEERLRRYLAPATGESLSFIRRTEGALEIERAEVRYQCAGFEVWCDVLERPAAGGDWTLPDEVTLTYASDAPSHCAGSIPASHASPFYQLGYRHE